MKRWASWAAWAAGRSRCTARAPPRSLTPGTTHGRGTRSTRGRCRCPRWTNTTDRPVGIGPLITVDTTRPVDVAAVAAEVRRLHTSYLAGAHPGHMSARSAEER
jgi:hypothetical protein